MKAIRCTSRSEKEIISGTVKPHTPSGQLGFRIESEKADLIFSLSNLEAQILVRELSSLIAEGRTDETDGVVKKSGFYLPEALV